MICIKNVITAANAWHMRRFIVFLEYLFALLIFVEIK